MADELKKSDLDYETINRRYLDEISEIIFSSERGLVNLLKGTIIYRNLWIRGSRIRNLKNQENKPENGQINTSNNFCELLTFSTDIPEEFCVYHSGPSNQEELQCNLMDFEQFSRYNHLFFSFDLRYVVSNYLLPLRCEDRSIYVTDVRGLKDSRIQINYNEEVLCDSRMHALIKFYHDPQCIKKYAYYKKKYAKYVGSMDNSTLSELDYVMPFINKPKEKLRQAITEEISGWLDRNTIPFDIRRLNDYKKNNQNYLLIPSPIKIIENHGQTKIIPRIKIDEETKIPRIIQ